MFRVTSELGKFVSLLSEPEAVYRGAGAEFELYRAKNLFDHAWKSKALKKVSSATRHSYAVYGRRNLFDAYDPKAAIYLARAKYHIEGNSELVEEWYSVRMVPGNGRPLGVGEPEIFAVRGKSVDRCMRFKLGRRNFWDGVASSSRMCVVRPYVLHGGGEADFIPDARNRYTAVCFALTHRQFVYDYPLAHFPYGYITAIIRPDFYEKGLKYVSPSGAAFRPHFTPAYEFLGIRKEDIAAKREVFSYEYPLYWFDAEKLLALINRLRAEQGSSQISKLEKEMFAGLAKKTRKPIFIAGIRIAPSDLRDLIDLFVPDMPELKITEASVWYAALDALIGAAQIS